MSKQENDLKVTSPKNPGGIEGSTWGRWLFIGVLVFTLVFFWWLLLYSHGVVSQHG